MSAWAWLLLLLLPLLLSTLLLARAQINLGSSLSASNPNQTWASPSNNFYVGFTRPSTTSSSYYATINYNGGVPVWSAGAASVDSKATLHLTSAGSLQLLNGTGAVVWHTNTTSLGVTSAELDDSGNLSLLNRSGAAVWSSFDDPTDAFVPNQNFTSSLALRSGPYSFALTSQGNITLKWNDTISYLNRRVNASVDGSNFTSPRLVIQSNGILQLSDPTLASSVLVAYSGDYGEGTNLLRFIKLDSDGNLRFYSSNFGSGLATAQWSAVEDQCLVYGYCGNLGMCSYNETSSSPVCGCPSQNFQLVDEDDPRQGCKRKLELTNCSGSASMLELNHFALLTYPPELESQVFSMTISACGSNCLSNSGGTCYGAYAPADGSGYCYLKTDDYLSGYFNPAMPSTSYIQVCGAVELNPPPGGDGVGGKSGGIKGWLVVVVVLGTLAGLVAVEGGLWCWLCKNSPKFGTLSAQYALLEYASGAPVQFSFKELQRSTGEFREKLGEGGFGAVYKGVLANRTVVAVKQLEGIEQGEKQFRMEVATISSTHHLNLVRLIGFCSEGKHRLLVYEFMKNGSLDSFLFSQDHSEQSSKQLTWEQRFNIALGTAKGITYLHEECRDCIVHCDIKPENILLDENFHAKVSDFGLAKLINHKDHRYRTLTSVRGTRGYLAPEWIANLPITSKSDVYSFGMVLLEIVSGRRNFEVSAETNRKKFSVWAYEEFDKGNVSAIMDKRLDVHTLNMDQVSRAFQVSFWCMQEQPSHRPMMGKVVQMLEGIAEIEKPPPPKVVAEGSLSSTSINISSNFSPLSTFAASAAAPSSSSSLQNVGISPLTSGRITDKASSSLLYSEDIVP